MFCLEETTTENTVIPIDFAAYGGQACQCRIHTHVDCWMAFILHKGRPECPICHKAFGSVNEVQVVVNNQVYQYSIPREATRPITTIIVPTEEYQVRRCGLSRQNMMCFLCMILVIGLFSIYSLTRSK